MIKLSVIIPLYNVEAHVSKGMESIRSQASEGLEGKLEIILVDDGSADRSLEVCLDHLGYLPGIKIIPIRQENTGPGGARNTGIYAAKGEYIMFMDSDDFLLPGAFRNILGALGTDSEDILKTVSRTEISRNEMSVTEKPVTEKPDLLFGRYQRWMPGKGFVGGKMHNFSPPQNDPKLLTEYILSVFPEPSWFAWRYICRRDLIFGQEIFFESGIYCEDMKWVLELLKAVESSSKRLVFLPEPFYGYNYRRPGSIMNSKSPKRLIDLAAIIAEALEMYQDRPAICHELVWQAFYYINEYCTFNKADRKLIYESYQKVLPLFNMSGSIMYSLAGKFRNPMFFYSLSVGLFGIKFARRVLVYGLGSVRGRNRRVSSKAGKEASKKPTAGDERDYREV